MLFCRRRLSDAMFRPGNRLFISQHRYDNTGDSASASLAFAEYDEAPRRRRDFNYGHLSG
jgi:hypothetical protein